MTWFEEMGEHLAHVERESRHAQGQETATDANPCFVGQDDGSAVTASPASQAQ